MFQTETMPTGVDLVLGGPVVLERPWVFDDAPDHEGAMEAIAELLQHRVDLAERAARHAEVRRLEALANAYDASMQDLAGRFGPRYGCRTGLGAQAFFK